jgi:putative serine protease PepD
VAVAAAVAGGAVGGVTAHTLSGDDRPAYSSSAPVRAATTGDLTGVAAVARAVTPSVVEITTRTSQGTGVGSGIVLDADGLILTNAHVVSSAREVTITFSDGRTATATVAGSDTASDLAVVRAQGVSGLTPATLGDSSQVRVGDAVVAIGSPEGLTGTVTSGIVSALDREVTVPADGSSGSPGSSRNPFGSAATSRTTTYRAIQTDAPINPGNSGGPLLDLAGRVIGVNSAIYSPTSGPLDEAGSVGLGFAIPVNQVKQIIQNLTAGS